MKTILILVLLTMTGLAFGQSIPNAGFENWTSCPSASDPIPFQTSNTVSFFLSGALNVEQSTNAHGGNYAAYLHADPLQQIQGYLSLGQDFNTGEISPLPFSGSPDSIGIWVQHNISDFDYGAVVITLYEDFMEVGFGVITFNGATSGYTYYSSPIDINAGTTPNGMTLGITSGDDASLNGELYIDDIHLIYNTGTGDDIPGGDFENWNITQGQCLDNWFNTNPYTLPNVSVAQGEPHSGNHSVQITNQPTIFGGGSFGYIILGNPELDFCDNQSLVMSQGQVATTVTGFYKYTAGNPTEMATFYMYYSSFNDVGECDSTYERYEYWPAVAEWTPFSVSVPNEVVAEWIASQQAPEFLSIGFVSTVVSNESEPNGDPNSVLLIDDLNVEYTPVGLNNPESTQVSVYPNPASNSLSIQWPAFGQQYVELVDAVGKIAMACSINGNNVQLDTSSLSSGVYTLRIRDEHSTSTQLVLIQH
ncbi:MAG: T9SS type A sorting domain-containing protein [Flavobacteriales bacterium]|jgi:hypothetical protein